jgi:hypothetical protein
MKQGNKNKKENRTGDIREGRDEKRPSKGKLIEADDWDKTSPHFLTICF